MDGTTSKCNFIYTNNINLQILTMVNSALNKTVTKSSLFVVQQEKALVVFECNTYTLPLQINYEECCLFSFG